MISPTITIAILVAIVGWFATIRAISTSRLGSRHKRWLLIPSWIPWIGLALGSPILSGLLALSEAIHIGGGLTAGLLVAVIISSRQSPKH